MLSNRLKKVASLIKPNSVIYDVGCDHGLIDIYLSRNLNCKCTAIDINKKCIEKSHNNFKKFHIDIPLVLNDGLKGIEIAKNSTVIILGMGTSTILNILDIPLDNVSELIIQTNNDTFKLRKHLSKLGFYIDKEEIIYKKKYYLIIKFIKGYKKYKYFDYLLGPILRNNIDPLVKNYYLDILRMLEKQYKHLYRLDLLKRIKLLINIKIIKRTLTNCC